VKTKFVIFILIIIYANPLVGQEKKQLLDQSILISRNIITNTAYCSDGSDRAKEDGVPRFHGTMEAKITSFNNYQYISYYESDGSLVVARKKMIDKAEWEKSVVQGYKIKSQDRHNKIAMEISKGDGVIHLSFDHHNTPQLNYAKSDIGVASNPDSIVWDNTVFSLLPNLGLKNDTGLVTYPSFYPVASTGNIIVYWRTGGAIGGEMNLANYNSKDHQWRFIGKISTREGTYLGKKTTRGPYHSGFVSDASGTLHLAWLWRERLEGRHVKDVIGNYGIFYAQSLDGGFTWKNSNGKEVANVIKNQLMGIDNIGNVPMEVPMEQNPTNVGFTSIVDFETGDFIAMLTRYIDKTTENSNFLYTRTPDGAWSSKETIMNGEGVMEFCKNQLFVFNETGIYYASRGSQFTDWEKIGFPFKFDDGGANWDTNQLEKGIITMAIQYAPNTIGEPSPIEIFDFKISR
jgi:hypothetical protein